MSTAGEAPDPAAPHPVEAVLDRSGLAGHPRGLGTLFFTEMWERFSYYGMRALLMLFMTSAAATGGLGLDLKKATAIYGVYTFSVYFTAIPGGWIADKLLGLRNAVTAGAILIALGHYSLILMGRGGINFFYAGLVLIVLGTGLVKPNISSIVGQLYPPGDNRRDAGFSIFYAGINLGGLLAPIPCGYLGQRVGWHWGFGAAALGMTFGVVQFVLGAKRLGAAGVRREPPKNAPLLWATVGAAVLLMAAGLYFFLNYRLIMVGLVTAAFFAWLLAQTRTAQEKKRVLAIFALFAFSTLFWSGSEQSGNSLTLFADRVTHNVILGWAFPSSWWQSVNTTFVVLLAPVFAWLWLRLGRREPSIPAKFSYALLFVGLGFLVLAWAARQSPTVAAGVPITSESRLPEAALVSPLWLLVVYLLHTIGEMCLSPVGLSAVTKLAPERLLGSMMGVWFLSIALGNMLGAQVAGYFETFALPNLFGAVFLTTTAGALLLVLLVPFIRRLMSGVH